VRSAKSAKSSLGLVLFVERGVGFYKRYYLLHQMIRKIMRNEEV
jgi:hypothetical protein